MSGDGPSLAADCTSLVSAEYGHADANGNVTQVVDLAAIDPNDPAAAVAASYEYAPFGERVNSADPNELDQPFRFGTKYYDEETGLYYFGHRYYNPTHGRWLNRDRIGELGGVNLYAYAANEPIDRHDPLGDEWILCPWNPYCFWENMPVPPAGCPGKGGGDGGGGDDGEPSSTDASPVIGYVYDDVRDCFKYCVVFYDYCLSCDKMTFGVQTGGDACRGNLSKCLSTCATSHPNGGHRPLNDISLQGCKKQKPGPIVSPGTPGRPQRQCDPELPGWLQAILCGAATEITGSELVGIAEMGPDLLAIVPCKSLRDYVAKKLEIGEKDDLSSDPVFWYKLTMCAQALKHRSEK